MNEYLTRYIELKNSLLRPMKVRTASVLSISIHFEKENIDTGKMTSEQVA